MRPGARAAVTAVSLACLALLALSGCSLPSSPSASASASPGAASPDQGAARAAAVKACAEFSPSMPVRGNGRLPAVDPAPVAAATDRAADAAARAALLDPAWQDMARAYSQMADAWSYAASFGKRLDRLGAAERADLLSNLAGEAAAESVVRAECRKAKVLDGPQA